MTCGWGPENRLARVSSLEERERRLGRKQIYVILNKLELYYLGIKLRDLFAFWVLKTLLKCSEVRSAAEAAMGEFAAKGSCLSSSFMNCQVQFSCPCGSRTVILSWSQNWPDLSQRMAACYFPVSDGLDCLSTNARSFIGCVLLFNLQKKTF